MSSTLQSSSSTIEAEADATPIESSSVEIPTQIETAPSTPKLSTSNTPTPITSPKSDITSNDDGLNSPLASTDSITNNNSTIDEKLSIDNTNTNTNTITNSNTNINKNTTQLTTTNSFEKALNDWTIIDLPNLQKELDLNGLEIQDFTKKSLISKKELATKTKQFKKLEKIEKLNQINPLLKLYQNEIDSLTKKNKNIENIFFKIYRLIAEAPDPKPLLKISLNAVTSIDDFEKINEEKEELENKLLNYLDYDQLKIQIEKLKNDSKIELKNQLNLKENEFQSLINEKILNWEKEKSDYKDKILKMTNQIEELKINEQVINLKLKKQLNTLDKIDDDDHDIDHDHNTNDKDIEGKTTEILDLNETDKSNLKLNTSKNLEIDILKKDIDSYKSRINNLELRNENLIKELTISKSNIEINKINNENNDKIKILENDNLILLGRLNNERKNFDNLIKKNNKKFENFKIEINSLNNEIKHLKKRYNDTIDYDEIKKELEIIKEIEFGELNINDNDEDTNNNNKKKIIKKLSSSSRSSTPIQDDDVDGDNYKDGQDDNDDDDDENDDNENNDENSEEDSLIEVESTLLMKNKKLTNELISLKNKNEELNKKLSNLELEINSKNNEINDLQLLNNQLENDLIDLNNNSQIRKNINDGTIAGSIINGGGANDDNWDTMSMISSVAGTVKTSRNSFNGSMSSSSSRLSPVSSIIGFDPSINSQQQQQQQQLNQQDSSILPIITQQRDRFRLRNKELEDDSKKQFGKIVELKREINSLKTDNRELYERIRFLQYNKDQNQKQVQKQQQYKIDLEKKYKDEYENDLHPIEQFRIMETKRINSRMSPFERIFIQVTKTILSTKYTRLLFVVYCCGLHFLVVLLTFYIMSGTTTSVSVSSSDLMKGSTGGYSSGNIAGAGGELIRKGKGSVSGSIQ